MKQRVSPDHITGLKENEVFVFGSNLKGMHGGGAAKLAHDKWGAEMGKAFGFTSGQTYAIPTVSGAGGPKLTLNEVGNYIDKFIKEAQQNSEKIFLVTEIGCGIAGFTVKEIAPLFKKALELENVYLPKRFLGYLT